MWLYIRAVSQRVFYPDLVSVRPKPQPPARRVPRKAGNPSFTLSKTSSVKRLIFPGSATAKP